MARGPKCGGQRARLSKHLRGASGKKRFKNSTESQAKYHAAIAARRAKKALKRKNK
jgi:hypothetical protein